MQSVGIICEYNPLHLGHQKQFSQIREFLGADTAIVCLMSGNFVQRGHPAIVDKSLRAKAAILCGADLVLELPLQACLSSAEGFAARGVEILSALCQQLCFGTETADPALLMQTAEALLSPRFPEALSVRLRDGLSFPAARQAALEDLGLSSALLQQPNNILAVEYCKAILSQNSKMKPLPILREGNYHSSAPDRENPSATAVRSLMAQKGSWLDYVPEHAVDCFLDAPIHTLQAGESAILYRLRTMTDAEFEALPYGSEGLWRKLMHSSRQEATLEDILNAVKSKRYTRTRLDRMVMCAALQLTGEALSAPIPYVRALAFNHRGRTLLKQAKDTLCILNAGEASPNPMWQLEQRAGDLYGLFAQAGPEAPGIEARRRVYYHHPE